MKYTEISVKPFVNVSSSGDYFVDVLYKENAHPENGTRFCRTFHLNAERFMTNDNQPGYVQMPKYATDEVLRQLRKLVEADELKPYEYDRGGNKRWSDLRYYERDVILEHSQEWPVSTYYAEITYPSPYNITEHQPDIGQRLLVFDRRYNDWIIGYWSRELRFEEWENGKERRILANFWLPLPNPPNKAFAADQTSGEEL